MEACFFMTYILYFNRLFAQSIITRNNMEIWAVELRFLLIYENMLKSIATARSECTAKHENKASYNTDYIVFDLINFLW